MNRAFQELSNATLYSSICSDPRNARRDIACQTPYVVAVIRAVRKPPEFVTSRYCPIPALKSATDNSLDPLHRENGNTY